MEELEIPDEVIERVINEVIDLFLIPRFRELGMPATGEWEQNAHARVNEVWGRDYTEYLVNGRPPNENQDPEALRRWAVWAGSTFIKDWAQAKGVPIDPIAIAYKIGRDGTDWYPNGSDLLEVLESQEVTDYIREQLTIFITAQVELKFRRYVQQTLETA